MEKRKQLFCLLRGIWVAELPEEIVRQQLVNQMIHQLGYPKGNLTLETSLHQFPHLRASVNALPSRRTDLICFAKGIHPKWELYPLLLVECKSVKLTQKAMTQLIGYNHFLNACFIALTNGQEMRVGWRQNEQYQFIDRLPAYAELMRVCRKYE